MAEGGAPVPRENIEEIAGVEAVRFFACSDETEIDDVAP